MTTKPELNVGSHLVPAVAAVALFGVMAAVIVTASFGPAQGFPSDANIVASIGYAMFNLDMGAVPGEGMLVAFIVIAFALDAALDGSLLLAKREEGGSSVALLADGGRAVKRAVAGTDGSDDEADDAGGGDP